MEIIPQKYRVSIDQATLLGGENEVYDSTQRIRNAYEELVRANDAMREEVTGDLRPVFFKASDVSEKYMEDMQKRLDAYGDAINKLRRESVKINQNASVIIGGKASE